MNQNRDIPNAWVTRSLLCLSGIVILFSYLRIYFGVDLTDEAYCVVLPYRFALGDRLFLDELHFHQFSAFLLTPFYRFFLWVHGTQDGIWLFSRHLYFVFESLIAGLIYFSLCSWVGKATAIIFSLTWLIYIPAGLPTLNYNTMGAGFFTAGLLLGYLNSQNRNPSSEGLVIGMGLLHGLATFSYPPLLAASCALVGIRLYSIKAKRATVLYSLFAFGLPITLLILNGIGPEQFRFMLEQTNALRAVSGYQTGMSKVIGIFTSAAASLVGWPYFIVGFLALLLIPKDKVKLMLLLLLAGGPPTIFFLTTRSSLGAGGAPAYVAFAGLFTPVYMLREYRKYKYLIQEVLFPLVVMGFIYAWTSGNGFVAAGLALLPAVFLGLGAFSIELKRIAAQRYSPVVVFGISLMPAALFLLGLFRYAGVCFGDGKIIELNARVESGVYEGIYTSEIKKQYVETLQKNLGSIENAAGRILFFPHLPGGYLMTKMRPLTRLLWNSGTYRQATADLDYIHEKSSASSVICHVYKIHRNGKEIEFNRIGEFPFSELLYKRYRLTLRHPDYDCYHG